MSNVSEPSAGTARPDAAPSDSIPFADDVDRMLELIETMNRLTDHTNVPKSDLRRLAVHIRALRSMLMSRESDKARLDWLESAVPSGEFRNVLNAMPTTIWDGSVRSLIDTAASAAVAPAAREPTTETSDGE